MHCQDDADLGAGDLGKASDLAGGVHAHLEYRRLVIGLQAEEGHRQSGLRVEIALVAKRLHRPREDVGRDLLGDRLARRPRDADDSNRMPSTPPAREVAESDEGVTDHDHGSIEIGRQVDRVVDEGGRCAGPQGLFHEPVAIHPFSSERHVAAERAHATRVDAGADDGIDRCGPEEPAAGGGQEVVEADRGRHANHAADYRRV